jgi:hypothetical protein
MEQNFFETIQEIDVIKTEGGISALFPLDFVLNESVP